MKEIPLTQGKVALVDDAEFLKLSVFRWCAYKRKNTWYAARGIRIKGRCSLVLMHRQVMGLRRGDGVIVDHIDHNGLNNQLSNLRRTTYRGNGLNRRSLADSSTSGVSGVTFYKRTGKWRSHVTVHGKQVHIGYFDHLEDAAMAVIDYKPKPAKFNK